jgi:hypothetical protein
MTKVFVLGLALAVLVVGSSSAQDKKKYFTIRVENSSRQVNNHPWAYTTPGQSNTDCSTNGNVYATGTTVGNTTNVNGTVSADTNCNTTYRPPQTTTGNRVSLMGH